MFTWSLRKYLEIVLIASIASVLVSKTGLYDIVGAVRAMSNYLAILSVSLVGFPLLAVPLMLQVITTAIDLVGEKPTKELYRDFNTACLLVSLGALTEIVLLLIMSACQEPGWTRIIISAVAFGNFTAFTVIFILVIVLLQKIVGELETIFTQ